MIARRAPVKFSLRFALAVLALAMTAEVQNCVIAQVASFNTKPRLIVILCKRLDATDLKGQRGEELRQFVATGSVALINTAAPVNRLWPNVLFTMAAGGPARKPPGFQGMFQPEERYPGHLANAGTIYARRYGTAPPSGTNRLVCPQIALLNFSDLLSQLPGALVPPGIHPVHARFVSVTCDTNFARLAAVWAMNSNGVAHGAITESTPIATDVVAASILRDTPALTIVAAASPNALAGTPAPALALSLVHQSRQMRIRCDVLLVGLSGSTITGLPSQWRSLSLVAGSGDQFQPGEFYSPTTRTLGLVADTDIQPTVLNLLGLPIPPHTTGRPLQSIRRTPSRRVLAHVDYLDTLANLNGQGTIEIMLPLALVGIALVSLCLLMQHSGKSSAKPSSWALLTAQSLPLSLIVAPTFSPHSLLSYGVEIGLVMLTLGLLSTTAGIFLGRPGTTVCTVIFVTVVVADLVTGGRLIKNSLLGGYALSGIRYYGLGNEYLGVVLGMALPLFATLAVSHLKNRQLIIAVLFAALIVVLGWPGWGANAGSLVVGSVAAVAVLWPASGRRFTLLTFVASIVAGFVLAFTFAAADAWLGGPNLSHAGEALTTAAGPRGAGYLMQIIERKLEMNVNLSISPWLLVAAATVTVFAAAMWYLFRRRIAHTAVRHPELPVAWRALGWTVLAALITKDSGIVTAVFAVGSATVITTWYAACGTYLATPGSTAQQVLPASPAPDEESV